MVTLYKALVRPILFQFDSEKVHDSLFSFLATIRRPSILDLLRIGHVEDPRLAVSVGGLKFPNPLGLAAGFDKNAVGFEFFEALSFGHVELGTITAVPQDGNPKPRIFRLIEDHALINRMGFPSKGYDAVVPRLKEIASSRAIPVGVNIGKSKVTPIDDAASDYKKTFDQVKKFADYVTVNVSSPNTPELRTLQEPGRLKEIFAALLDDRDQKPVFVKLAPDLSDEELDSIVDTCIEAGVRGIIATNTTLSRKGLRSPLHETGGLSGEPLRNRSLDVVQHVANRAAGRLAIIGAGGIFTAEDVLAYLKAGASAVQIYTALVYEGPFLVRAILRDLSRYMDHYHATSLNQLVNSLPN